MWLFVLTGFASGILGSFHCVGMCGPIMLAIPQPKNNPWKQIASISMYHLGRVFTYVILGLIFSFIGSLINLFVVQQWISIGTGVLILLMVLFKILKLESRFNNRYYLKFNSKIQFSLKRLFRSDHPLRLLGIGAVNGLLPCTMSFMAITASIGVGSKLGVVLFMTAFGIGTIPLVFIFNLLSEQIKRFKFKKYKQILLSVGFLIGIVFIFRGLNLGIDYISPKLEYEDGKLIECSHLGSQ